MWLLYQLLEETDTCYRYAYSRENQLLDGVLKYEKADGSIIVEKPCIADENCSFAMQNAVQSFQFIVDAGFPGKKRIAFG